MNSQKIADSVYVWASSKNFTAPYGILQGQHVNRKGNKYHSITFGRARTLDVTVEVYNRNFIIVKSNCHGVNNFKSYNELQKFLDQI